MYSYFYPVLQRILYCNMYFLGYNFFFINNPIFLAYSLCLTEKDLFTNHLVSESGLLNKA